MDNGRRFPDRGPSIVAPIVESGMTTRPIGRFLKLSSPVMTEKKDVPASTPHISLAAVPEFPKSRMSSGSCRQSNPGLSIWTEEGSGCQTWTPRRENAERVRRQSSEGRNPVMLVLPEAIPPKMTERWETDLSPGTRICPVICRVWRTIMVP
jgi:hypothetical protein